MNPNNYGSEGERTPTPKWDGVTERRRLLRSSGNGSHTIDQKLDRFIKIATIIKWFVLPVFGAVLLIGWQNYMELTQIEKKIDSTYQLITLHDRFRRSQDKTRMQTHHQMDIGHKDSCIKCKITEPQSLDLWRDRDIKP